MRPSASRRRRSSGRPSTARRSTWRAFAGKPVVVNFWGPCCVPCRDEFPLLEAKLAEHAADGLTVVGVLTDDPVEPARDFVAEYGGQLADRRRPRQGDQDRLPRRRPAADLLRRSDRGHPLDPDRRADRRRLRAPVRADRAVTTGDPVVVVDGLVKRYGPRTVLDGVSLTVGGRGARRAARTERGGQDDDRRDHRGLPARRRRARRASSGVDPAAGGRGASGRGSG